VIPRPHRNADFEFDEGHVIAERYELAGILGSGAETLVFGARDLFSGDEIAVKVFRATALQNPAALKTFKRDLSVLRDGSHPSVVQILDFGEIAGTFYVAMELIRDAPLSLAANGNGWSPAGVLELLDQITGALAWLHSRGVVHGDIRTSNIVWNAGKLKLMDFGTQRDSRQVTVRAPDSCCAYSSPEHLLGRPLTAASDLYSAAAVMYHLLVGEPPHARAGLLERAMAEAPSLRARAPEVPEELAGILERCLNPDPTLRPAGAAQIAEECQPLRGADAGPSEPQLTPVLADRIGEEPLDVTELSALLLKICRVLRDIHDAGLAHPDLSPRNIRLAGDSGDDVDIQAFPAPPPNATLRMTEPKYAAPEMLLTHTTTDERVHFRSDIYVLGFVAYELLAGSNAFRRQLFEDTDEPETDLFWMKWHADPAKRLKPLSDVNPSVAQEVSMLIQRMIEKDPAARPLSLNDVESAVMQLQRRFETTDDIEMASLPEPASAPATDVKAHGQKRNVLPRVLLLMCVLACGGAAWWLSTTDSRPSSMLADALSWAKRKAAEARVSVDELLPKPPTNSSAPGLASTIDTANGPMVLVPAGNFEMGSGAVPNETPARTVHLPAFYIDKYEVSNGRYRAFTDSTGYWQPSAPSWDPDYLAKSSHPVLNVSWRDAQAFCIAVGKRLPTEAEWEKAARGSSPGSRFWANWTVNGLANLKRTGSTAPTPVGAFSVDVSPFGAYDMAGNVHEWVNDQYGLYSGNPASLDREDTAKVVRGGSFALAPVELSPSWRASLEPSITPGSDSPVGFRCAVDPRPSLAGAEVAHDAISRPRGQSRP
jgi:formylglycine-generating enzyme required for sulfatase activity/tRNA A-37 threonylcarbamoyl transferase component Bud32